MNQITRMVYNASGQVVQRIAVDPNGDGNTADNQVTRYVYADELTDKGSEVPSSDLLRAVIYPDSDDTVSGGALSSGADGVFDRYEYTYWADGSMKTMTDPRGVVHEYAYDALGRRTADSATSLGRADQNVSGTVRMIGTAYDDLGRRASVTSYGDTAGTVVRNQIAWTYNGFGNVTASAQEHNGLAGAGTPTVQYGWDYGIDGGEARYNRLSSMTYSGGRTVGYDYGSTGVSPVLGQVMGITNGSGTQTYATYGYLGEGTIYSVTTSVASLNYDPAEDGSFTGWDELGRVVGQTWKNPGGTALDSYSYTYDHAGNRLTRTNNLNSIYSESYQYDGLDRLIDADRDGSDLQSWDLDQVGNWAGFTDRGSGQTRTTNAANELQSISGAYTPVYDAAGNLTVMPDPKAMSQYLGAQWDAWNRLTGVFDSSGTVAEYEYDGLNRRISKTVGSGESAVTTDYIYNENWQVVEEVVTNANHQPLTTNHYIWDLRYIDSPVVRFQDANADGDLADAGDSTLYYLTDANMNVTALVDGTAGSATEGQVVERYVYDPYGKHLVLAGNWQPATGNSSAYDNAIRFGGYRFDAETGLFQVRNRYLHDTIGWISRDPEGYVDGMGLYVYSRGAPLNSTDPTGEDSSLSNSIAATLQSLHAELAQLEGMWRREREYFYNLKEFSSTQRAEFEEKHKSVTRKTRMLRGQIDINEKAYAAALISERAEEAAKDQGEYISPYSHASLGIARVSTRFMASWRRSGNSMTVSLRVQRIIVTAAHNWSVPSVDTVDLGTLTIDISGDDPSHSRDQITSMLKNRVDLLAAYQGADDGLANIEGLCNLVPFFRSVDNFSRGKPWLADGLVDAALIFGPALALKAAKAAAPALRAGRAGLGTRVGEIHGALHPIAQAQRTTAVLETSSGTRIVAGGARDLTRAQRELLGSGEVAAKLPGAHAEVTALQHAAQNGMLPSKIVVSRKICPECIKAIEAAGGKITSPTTAEWPR